MPGHKVLYWVATKHHHKVEKVEDIPKIEICGRVGARKSINGIYYRQDMLQYGRTCWKRLDTDVALYWCPKVGQKGENWAIGNENSMMKSPTRCFAYSNATGDEPNPTKAESWLVGTGADWHDDTQMRVRAFRLEVSKGDVVTLVGFETKNAQYNGLLVTLTSDALDAAGCWTVKINTTGEVTRVGEHHMQKGSVKGTPTSELKRGDMVDLDPSLEDVNGIKAGVIRNIVGEKVFVWSDDVKKGAWVLPKYVNVTKKAVPKGGDSVMVSKPFDIDGFSLQAEQTGTIQSIEDDGAWWITFAVAGDDSDEDETETLMVPPDKTDNLQQLTADGADIMGIVEQPTEAPERDPEIRGDEIHSGSGPVEVGSREDDDVKIDDESKMDDDTQEEDDDVPKPPDIVLSHSERTNYELELGANDFPDLEEVKEDSDIDDKDLNDDDDEEEAERIEEMFQVAPKGSGLYYT